MYRHVINIKGLGRDVCWMLVQQALGMRDARARSDFFAGKVALLIFGELSLPERLCVTGAVRQMGGTTIYEGERRGQWRDEWKHFQKHLLPVFGYYVDCLYTYGMPIEESDMGLNVREYPLINAGNAEAHPSHALADIACMLRVSRELDGLTLAWVGGANGTLRSLMAATRFFPFSMRVALPHCDVSSALECHISCKGLNVKFVDSPSAAASGADYVFAGCRSDCLGDDRCRWAVNGELMAACAPGSHLMLGARPVAAVPVEASLMSGPASLLEKQAEYRLRVHKRILHWVFEDAGHEFQRG